MRVGSMFTGAGGLDMAVADALGGTVAWQSEVDPGACRVLAHRHPDVPNLGDITAVDWSRVEPVDVLAGGFPCQDVSTAGARHGLNPGTRSGLWQHMASVVGALRPALAVIENVRGLLSAPARSDVESCPWCVGDGAVEPPLRALGAVLGDLADLGYDARWACISAADVGAPHRRERVFIVTHLADSDLPGLEGPQPAQRHVMPAALSLLPTPRATDGPKGGPGQRNGRGQAASLPAIGALLPTPVLNDMGAGKTVEQWDGWTGRMRAKHSNGNGHGKSLAIEAQRLLPTPTAMDSRASGGGYNGQTNVTLTDATSRWPERWGVYGPAIRRWEALTRPAPSPTDEKGRLNPEFAEWMLGWPQGWVTDPGIGLSHTQQLKIIGNGVVPAQAAAALRLLLTSSRAVS